MTQTYHYGIEDMERDGIVRKMILADHVVFGADGRACNRNDLRKFDLPLLRILSRNAKTDPAAARQVYAGGAPDELKKFIGADGKPLSGDALVEAGFAAAGYTDINKMIYEN